MLGSVTCREKPIWSDSKNAFYKISLGGVCFLPGGPYEIQIIESPLKNPLQAPSVIGDSGTALKDGHP
ncbi:hypothetical protein, partial [Xanthomonas campestris]